MNRSVRYVVLHHTGVATPHFDLMVEQSAGELLWTWRLSSWPIDAQTRIERIADHRNAYLEYEGPISGDRGEVRRIAFGIATFESNDAVHLQLRIDGAICFLPSSARA